jgi:hypothetical protein
MVVAAVCFAACGANLMTQLHNYLADIINLLKPFASSPSNPHPGPPPPYVHTRVARLASLIRETLAHLEPHMQPQLDAAFTLRPPGDAEATEAEREMLLIRRRRQELQEKAAAGKRDLTPMVRPGPGGPGARQGLGPGMGPGPGTGAGAGSAHGPAHAGHRYAPPALMERRASLTPRPRDAWRCHGCGTTHATVWHTGPDGSRTLCENCGVS